MKEQIEKLTNLYKTLLELHHGYSSAKNEPSDYAGQAHGVLQSLRILGVTRQEIESIQNSVTQKVSLTKKDTSLRQQVIQLLKEAGAMNSDYLDSVPNVERLKEERIIPHVRELAEYRKKHYFLYDTDSKGELVSDWLLEQLDDLENSYDSQKKAA